MEDFLASLPPTLTVPRYRYARAMVECCVTEHFQRQCDQYTTLLYNLTIRLVELADRPDWAEAWELGVRWAFYKPQHDGVAEDPAPGHGTGAV